VIGFDALPEALVAISEGRMAATIEQFPGGQARTALDILVAFLREGTEPAEHDTYLEPALLTADNLAEAERAAEAGVGGGEGTPEAMATPAAWHPILRKTLEGGATMPPHCLAAVSPVAKTRQRTARLDDAESAGGAPSARRFGVAGH
jgi:hypothetical protein